MTNITDINKIMDKHKIKKFTPQQYKYVKDFLKLNCIDHLAKLLQLP